MASADFCAFSAVFLIWPQLLGFLSELSAQTSPGTTRFFPSIYLPHLSPMIPCSYWASACRAVLPSWMTFYVVSVRQARGLPVVSLLPHPASFRSRLTTDTLAFGYLLPATGRIRVFHPLETCAAGRTCKKPADFHKQAGISITDAMREYEAKPWFFRLKQIVLETGNAASHDQLLECCQISGQ